MLVNVVGMARKERIVCVLVGFMAVFCAKHNCGGLVIVGFCLLCSQDPPSPPSVVATFSVTSQKEHTSIVKNLEEQGQPASIALSDYPRQQDMVLRDFGHGSDMLDGEYLRNESVDMIPCDVQENTADSVCAGKV